MGFVQNIKLTTYFPPTNLPVLRGNGKPQRILGCLCWFLDFLEPQWVCSWWMTLQQPENKNLSITQKSVTFVKNIDFERTSNATAGSENGTAKLKCVPFSMRLYCWAMSGVNICFPTIVWKFKPWVSYFTRTLKFWWSQPPETEGTAEGELKNKSKKCIHFSHLPNCIAI